jgi:hypothetical protein
LRRIVSRLAREGEGLVGTGMNGRDAVAPLPKNLVGEGLVGKGTRGEHELKALGVWG